MTEREETLEGYVVDIACLRRYPRAEWAARAHAHAKACALEGHCVESGYALVGEDGNATLLDAAATPAIVSLATSSGRERGLRVRVRRRLQDGDMATVEAQEIAET